MNVTIVQLRSFCFVAEELHFGRAAAALRISSSTLSEHILLLEKQLGRQLFARTSRSVRLTDDGRALIPLARAALASMDEVLAFSIVGEESTELKVGLMVSSPGFQEILSRAARQMKEIRWEIRQLGFLGCYDALANGEVDCIFVAEIGEVPFPEFESLPLWDEQCMVVLADHHPLALRSSVSLADLENETFVTVADAQYSSRWLSKIVGAGGAEPRMLPVAQRFEEVLELCAAGLGVNICGESAAQLYSRPGVRFVPIGDAPRITTYLCLPRGRHTVTVDAFARLAVKTAHAPR